MESSTSTVSLYLRPGRPLPEVGSDGTVPRHTRADFATTFGSTQADRAAVATFATRHGLEAAAVDMWRYDIIGPLASMKAAFGAGVSEDSVDESLQVPKDLENVVLAAFAHPPAGAAAEASQAEASAKADRQSSEPTSGGPTSSGLVSGDPEPSFSPPIQTGILPRDVAALLQFPGDDLLGKGETIAVLEGSGEMPSTYSDDLDLALQASYPDSDPVPVATTPEVLWVAGAEPSTNGIDEVELDLQLVQTLAPSADVLVVFYGPGEIGILTALATAIMQDGVSVITWSDEIAAPAAGFLEVLQNYCQAAAAIGITVCKGAGDNGAFADRPSKSPAVYTLPAIPWVLSSGGVMLADATAGLPLPVVWNTSDPDRKPHYGASGGGFTAAFPLPAWQQAAVEAYPNPGAPYPVPPNSRGVPDVASVAHGLLIYRKKAPATGGGCSATGPVMAAMIARLNAVLGTPIGFINAVLYQNPSICQDVAEGNNGVQTIGPGWSAATGWDPCTGLGLPNARAILELFQNR